MGVSIRQKKRAGPYWVFVAHDGRRTSKSVGTRKAALELKAAIEAEIAKGSFSIDAGEKMPTFGAYAKKWLESYVETACRASTFDNYESVLRIHVLPAFKNKPLDQISRGDIRDFLLSKARTLSIKYVLLVKDVLSGVLGWALDEGLITANPAIGATKKLFKRDETGKKAETQDEVWNEAELEAFLETCRERAPAFYPFFLTLARTGCRLGEALALKWIGVDFAERVLSIRESYRRGRLTLPKNGKARKVDMSGQLAEALEAWKPGKFVDAKALVFPNEQGGCFEQNDVRKVFWKITKAAKVKTIKLHGLRHSFASILLSKGANVFYVSTQLGHSSINITTDIYGHWLRNDQNRHVNLLDSVRQTAPPAHPGESERAATI
jgi:integrase